MSTLWFFLVLTFSGGSIQEVHEQAYVFYSLAQCEKTRLVVRDQAWDETMPPAESMVGQCILSEQE